MGIGKVRTTLAFPYLHIDVLATREGPFNMNIQHIKKAALGACAASALLSGGAVAQETVPNATVDVTLQNSFTLTQTTPMEFGTIALMCDTGANNTTTATLSTAGILALGAPSGNAIGFDIDPTSPNPRSQAVFDVTGAAPNAALSVTLGGLTNLTCAACGGGNPAITLTSLSNSSNAGVLTTNNAGDATLNVGAVLTTLGSCPAQYLDGLYQGTYDLTISY